MTVCRLHRHAARERFVAAVPVARLMPMADRIDACSLRAANEPTRPSVAELVDAAYGHCVDGSGWCPGP